MRPKFSPIWKYFTEINTEAARCRLCGQNYSRKGRGTSALRNHLQSRHKTAYAELYENSDVTLKQAKVEKKRKISEEIPLQMAKQQVTLEMAAIQDESSDNGTATSHEELDNLICEMIAMQDLPFSFVEGIGFRRFVSAAQPEYNLKEREWYTWHLFNNIYPKLCETVKSSIEGLQYVSITADIQKDPGTNASLLSFTAHGIYNFERIAVVLKCVTVDERHTGDLVAQKLKEVREEWKIPREKLHALVRDDQSSKRRGARMFDDMDCILHQLLLCVRAAVASNPPIATLFAKCKKIAAHLNESFPKQTELNDIQDPLDLHQFSVIQECSTWRNSVFHMIEGLIKIKDTIKLFTSQHQNSPQLTPNDWLQLEICAKILQPYDEIKKSMSSTDACISSVIPLISVLVITMQKISRDHVNDENCKCFIKKLIEEVIKRFRDLHSHGFYAISTYLDPKYKTKFFNEITKVHVESKLLNWLTSLDQQIVKTEVTGEEEYSDSPQPSTSFGHIAIQQPSKCSDSIISTLAQILDDENDNNEGSSPSDRLLALKSLLNDYTKEKRINIQEDSLSWWKNNPKYYELYGAVQKFLSPPPASVAKERLLTNAKLPNEEINRLTGDTASKLLFIKANLEAVDFDY